LGDVVLRSSRDIEVVVFEFGGNHEQVMIKADRRLSMSGIKRGGHGREWCERGGACESEKKDQVPQKERN
jgi:hypothetical protein